MEADVLRFACALYRSFNQRIGEVGSDCIIYLFLPSRPCLLKKIGKNA